MHYDSIGAAKRVVKRKTKLVTRKNEISTRKTKNRSKVEVKQTKTVKNGK